MKDTDASDADLIRSPSLPSSTQANEDIERLDATPPPELQFPTTPPLLSARYITSPPPARLDIPTSSHPEVESSEDDSDDGLFSIPLSARRSTIPIEHKYSGPTLSAEFDETVENVEHEKSASSGVQQVPSVPPLELEQHPVQFKSPRAELSYTYDLYANEHLITAQEEEDVPAVAAGAKFRKQEHISPTCSTEGTAVLPKGGNHDTPSPPGAQGASHGVAGEAPMTSLKDSSEINLTVSKPTGKADGSKAKVTPVSFPRVGWVERAKLSNSAVPAFESKPRTTLLDRAKYQFEADSDDDELEDEIDANLEELSGTAGRLRCLARAAGDEVEAQNQHLQRISMKVSVDTLYTACDY